MKYFITIIYLLLLCGSISGQNYITLTFEAEEAETGNSLSLDSVYVLNMDKGCDTILYEGEDLVLDILSGFDEQELIQKSARVFPNPFVGNTNLSIPSNSTGPVSIRITNLNGSVLHAETVHIHRGNHEFHVSTSERITILTIEDEVNSSTFKLVNNYPVNSNEVTFQLTNHWISKSTTKDEEFIYQNGDELLLVGHVEGYIPDSLTDSPEISTLYSFEMEDLPPPELPIVETQHITEILHTSVTAGGHVIHNGWIPLTARGLCWSTDPVPTIDDNYTEEGTGLGPFASMMTALDTNTTYFVRAYATNAVGTSYGEEYSFTSKSDIPCPGIPGFSHGGQYYETVLIGTQCWMKEHLNIGTMIMDSEEPEDDGVIEKWCYDDDPDNCDTYGGLYNWDEVMKYDSVSGSQGICPDNWHIPTHEELKTLEGTADSQYPVSDPIWDETSPRGFDVCTNLKSSTGWISNGNGTDVYGFQGMPAGYRWANGGFTQIEEEFLLWSSTQVSNPDFVWVRNLRHYESQSINYFNPKHASASVRCIHNDSF